VLDGFDRLPIGIQILEGLAMLDKLFAGTWVLPFGKPVKLVGSDSTSESILLGKPALPLSLHGLSLTPITLVG
jgi:hypothetical protein